MIEGIRKGVGCRMGGSARQRSERVGAQIQGLDTTTTCCGTSLDGTYFLAVCPSPYQSTRRVVVAVDTPTMASEATTFPAPQSDLRILLLGGGGREHALAYKLAQSPRVAKIFVVPGNGGTEMMGGKVENVKIPWGGKHGYLDVVTFAVTEQVDLAVPGPEQPLVDGVESLFRKGEFLSTTKDGMELIKRWYLCLWTQSRCRSSRRIQIIIQSIHGST